MGGPLSPALRGAQRAPMPTRHHVLQSDPNTCVAACAAMLWSRRGQPHHDEAAVIARWGPPSPLGYSDPVQRLRGELSLPLASSPSWEEIKIDLEHGDWFAAVVFPAQMTAWAVDAQLEHAMPYGRLVKSPSSIPDLWSTTRAYKPLHTLLLTGHVKLSMGWRLELLDPWIEKQEMPLYMTEEDFLKLWTHQGLRCP